ncbi:hypothetical protein TWF694_009331 [Orbilia ellipsospora]|uniref:BTB domain-containing protein n=1 Tax=Orbilia ellipsospora TaxID=2528407 RepID=A0AAV9XFK2_9PEZI
MKEYEISSNVDLIIHLHTTPPPPPATSPSTYDVIVVPDTIRYYATAWSLQQASRVFSRIISPDKRFQQPTKAVYDGRECSIITLEDDDPRALALVLHLLHFNTKSLPGPESITWNIFYEIAVIWDKYDISNLIRPPWVDYFKHRKCEVGYEDWLFIGRVFRLDEGYAEVTAKLIVEAGERRYLGKDRHTGMERGGFLRGSKFVDIYVWPDFVREHITGEKSRLMKSIENLMENWKRSFKGKRPRVICTCYGNVQRYNRHTSLSNDIATLLSQNNPSFLPQNLPVALQDAIDGVRLGSRFQDLSPGTEWKWNGSIADLRKRMVKIRANMSDRYSKGIRHLLECADIYELCPLEESALRVLLDFDETIAFIRGIGIDGNIVDVPLGEVIPQAKSEPWNPPMETNWEGLAMLGVRVAGAFVAAGIILLAFALGGLNSKSDRVRHVNGVR